MGQGQISVGDTIGTWSVVWEEYNGDMKFFLLEHVTCTKKIARIVIDEKYNLISDDCAMD